MSFVSALNVPSTVAAAIKTAARATGTDFDYLVNTAARESSFQADAQAKTSSAKGLFQFIENTWLQTVKEEGPRFGLGDYAAFILKGSGGRYSVSDPGLRQEILALRSDPKVAAVMAGALTRQNAAQVGAKLGREPTAGELYLAHVLGPAGAARMISLAADQPDAAADAHFPAAARANRALFYHGGSPRSVSEVMGVLVRGHAQSTPAAPANAPGADKTVTPLIDGRGRFPVDTTKAVAPLVATQTPRAADRVTPAGGIGAWTTLVHPAAQAGPIRTGGAEARAAHDPAPRAELKVPRGTEQAQPRGIKIPSAAFRLFSDEFMNNVGMTGA